MKTNFVEYYNKREQINSLIESVVIEAQNNPEFLKVLEEAGFWSNLANAGKQVWQGLKQTGQAAWSQMTGPATQYGNAIAAIKKATQQLEQDPNWKNSTTTGASGKFPAMNLIDWLKSITIELESQQGQLANKQMSGAQTQAAQPTPGVPMAPPGTPRAG